MKIHINGIKGLAVWASINVVFQILLYGAFVKGNSYALSIMQITIGFVCMISILPFLPGVQDWLDSGPRSEVTSDFKLNRWVDGLLSIGYLAVIIYGHEFLLASLYATSKVCSAIRNKAKIKKA